MNNNKAIVKFFTILFLTGIISYIIWLITPPFPEGYKYTFISALFMSGIVAALFWKGGEEIISYIKNEDGQISTGIIAICGGLAFFAMAIFMNLDPPFSREQSYISTYQVHYLDGTVDTAYVTGEGSQEASVDSPGFLGGGYSFCGEEGIYRVRLLKVSKSKTKVNEETIKLKNNK